jgi:hypothetical protein
MMKTVMLTHAILNWQNPRDATDANLSLKAALAITDGIIAELSK